MHTRLFALSILLFSFTLSAALPRPTIAENGMVASAHKEASKIGRDILAAGGNAVDAAIATTFAISVTLPYSAGIGGGGFMLYRDAKSGETHGLDFRERAPAAATTDMYWEKSGPHKGDVIKKRATDGYLSVAVPGTVRGMKEAHDKYGRLPWRQLLEPSIKLARDGFTVSELYERYVTWRYEALKASPAAMKVFTKNGQALKKGERLIQKDLAKTLERIAQDPDDFYTGTTAALLVKDIQQHDGLMTAQDLKDYQSIWRTPVCGTYRDAEVCAMAPPSSGGIHLIQILNVLEQATLADSKLNGDNQAGEVKTGWNSVNRLHHMIESMRQAYADRSKYLGDPDFIKVPTAALTSKAYATNMRKAIPLNRARRSEEVEPVSEDVLLRMESKNTSHLTVVDKDRNAVSLTFTVNYGFGSGVVAEGTGILLNDEMDDFSAKPGVANAYGLLGGEANKIEPKKTPLSSMTPTIVSKNGRLWFATGSPGGSTIITTSLQTTLNVIDHDMNASEAVNAPRIHHQWYPDYIRYERFGLDPQTKAELEALGHKLVLKSGWGNAHMVLLREDGQLEGGSDIRGEGGAFGY